MDCPPKPGAPLRVLVVDDSTDTATSTAELLTAHGFVVQETTNGHEAIQMAHAEMPDVVLLDLSMPVVDGFEVARQIRAGVHPGARPPILIAVTGHGYEDDLARTAAAGFHRHLTKPVEPALLIDVLRQLRSLCSEKI